MQCLQCGGQLEWAGGGQHARCTRCLAIFNQANGHLTPIVVEAPGGGFNPEFNAIFAQNLGFGPPPPGAQPMPPPQQQGGYPQQQQHNLAAGQFDMGGGQQLHVKINGKTPEGYLKDKASSMIWGWIIGGAILFLIIVVFAGVGLYIYATHDDPAAPKTASAGTWDGKSTFECKGNDAVTLTGVTASAGVKASNNCQLTLTGVSITAPVAIDASGNAQVNMTGGAVNASTNSVVASGNAKVNLVGTKVTGKSKKSGGAQVNGAP